MKGKELDPDLVDMVLRTQAFIMKIEDLTMEMKS